MSDCIFCRIAAGEIPAERVFEDDQFLAFKDINPHAPTHLVVIPKRHVALLTDLGGEEAAFAGGWLLAANRAAAAVGVAESGYRVVANCNADAGQEVFHIHMHVLGGRRLGWPPG
ncbi:MAG: histidine triad nucleotide-binding protein [Candidatus Latescibacteria bacterium]|jgi:histidine triad (HIT) family protein|nr:histidine triad nucleotide-binding protein [Candidatus Latescibacterota bacterium]